MASLTLAMTVSCKLTDFDTALQNAGAAFREVKDSLYGKVFAEPFMGNPGSIRPCKGSGKYKWKYDIENSSADHSSPSTSTLLPV